MIMVVDTFRCGHARTAENTARNGNKNGCCRECHNARNRRRASTPEGRTAATTRMRKHRGEPRGHRNTQKAACPAGHAYDDENTYWYDGARQCKTCRRAATTAYYHGKRANGGEHTDEEWVALCAAYGNRCLCCKRDDVPLTRDHVIPVSLGGSNAIENIQPLCRPCNSAKKDNHIDFRPRLAVAV